MMNTNQLNRILVKKSLVNPRNEPIINLVSKLKVEISVKMRVHACFADVLRN